MDYHLGRESQECGLGLTEVVQDRTKGGRLDKVEEAERDPVGEVDLVEKKNAG